MDEKEKHLHGLGSFEERSERQRRDVWVEIDGTENQMQVDSPHEGGNHPTTAAATIGDHDGAGASGGDIQGPGNIYFEGFGTNSSRPGTNAFTVKKHTIKRFNGLPVERKCVATLDKKNKDER